MNKTSGVEHWPASSITMRDIEELTPYERNARKHSPQQIAQIVESIKEWGWTIPVLIDEQGGLIAGHGRVLAAKELGIKEVPTMTARDWTDAQKQAYVIADNKLALNADWDEAMLSAELASLFEQDFDVSMVGFSDEELAEMFEEEGLSEQYTDRIESPLYEPEGERPKLSELLDTSKADDLETRIKKAKGVSAEIKAFLIEATKRHYVFRYDKIASYYAHAPAEVQELMEQSALVIIDYDKAIEEGYIKMNKALSELRNDSGS